jgi:hypothetical protein
MFVCTIYDLEMIVRMALLHLRIYLVRRCLLLSILKLHNWMDLSNNFKKCTWFEIHLVVDVYPSLYVR